MSIFWSIWTGFMAVTTVAAAVRVSKLGIGNGQFDYELTAIYFVFVAAAVAYGIGRVVKEAINEK